MQNTKKHDTKIDDTKMQEKGNQKSGSGTLSQQTPVAPVLPSLTRGSRDTSKHVSEVKHESHKDEYRRDHAQAETGVKNPAASVMK
jgi:hypothetical protein